MPQVNVKCGEHNTTWWAAVVSPSGAIFHVCEENRGVFLYPGAPAAGYAAATNGIRAFLGTLPPGWLKLGW